MSLLPVKKITLPKDLRDQANGKVDAALLRPIKPSGYLHHIPAQAWKAMCAKALAEGVQLTHVGAYRTYLRQVTMFRLRYSKSPTGRDPQVTRTWQNVVYYLRRGMSPSASPGTSNHGLGISIDVALKVAGKTVNIGANPDGPGGWVSGTSWLARNAVAFGFCWEVADPSNPNFEPWHLVYYAGDIPPSIKTVN
jgi:LAS superfamily LD-carboxypeptidase LdcB